MFVDSLRRVVCRITERYPGAAASSRSFPMMETLEGRLQLSAAGGAALLAVNPPASAPPAGSLLPDMVPWVSRARNYIYGWTLDEVEQPGKVLLRLSTAMANIGRGPLELRGGPVVKNGQEVSQRIYQPNGGHVDREAGIFTHHPEHNHTHFDDFAIYRLRQITAAGGVGKLVRSGRKISFCLTDSDMFNDHLANASADGEYFACSGRRQGISVGWADVYSSSLPDQWVDVTGVPDGKYWLEVTVDPNDRLIESNEKNNTRRIQIMLKLPAKPANDELANAMELAGEGDNVAGTNAGATRQGGEPKHSNIEGGTSLWYKWTATTSARVTISTAGSKFDTLLGIYTGSDIADLTRIASNDDEGAGIRTSKASFNADAGVTYLIALDGYRGATGAVRLSLSVA